MNCYKALNEASIISTYVQSTPCVQIKAIPNKENTEMNTVTNIFETERRALRDLLCNLERSKIKEIRKVHHMDPKHPETYGELKKLLKEGKINFHPEYDTYEDDEEIPAYLSWHSMLTLDYQKPNRKAYSEAHNKIEKETQRLRTQIAVLPPEEALKKLEAFESKTIH